LLRRKLILLLVLALFAFLPSVHANPVTVSVSPTSQSVPQGNSAAYTVSLSLAMANASYSLTLSGLPSGQYSFSTNPIVIGNVIGGAGSSSLTIPTTTAPGLYCPGTYPFTVTASSSSPSDSGSASGVLNVIQVGPPLTVTVSTDKTAYHVGDKITITVSVNRPAEGRLIIAPPTGNPTIIQASFSGPTFSIVKTMTAGQPIGQYTVSFQADDYCGYSTSAIAYFNVSPNTYDVSVSFSGLPPQVPVGVQVDGQSEGTMLGSEIKTLTFPINTVHNVTVDPYVAGTTGVRYYCGQNSWSVSSSTSRTFTYQTQYLFTVTTNPNSVTQVSGGGWFPAGTSVQTSQAPPKISGGAGTQYTLKGWQVDGTPQSGNPLTITLDGPHTATATYTTQYQLTVDSQFGNPQGAGYYNAGSAAQFSVTTPSGFPVQQIFVRWEGDYNGTSAQGSITMDRPHIVHAVWSTSYLPLIGIVVVAAAIVGGLLFWRSRRGGGGTPETKPTPSTPAETGAEQVEQVTTLKCAKCGSENAADQKFCTNCGETLTPT
jgi:hypothetical protein